MNKTEPLLAVVIVSWNRRDDLDRLLRSIERQDRINLHVVVVDNGSADGTAEMLRSGIHPNTTVYFGQKNIGAAVALLLSSDAGWVTGQRIEASGGTLI